MQVVVNRFKLDEVSFDELPGHLSKIAVRAGVLSSIQSSMHVEVTEVLGLPFPFPGIGNYMCRRGRRDREFVAVMLIPTGIGCTIGGHAGDAGAVARLLGSVVDTLVLHPNVVNASDINEMPDNALYVEGSTLTQFMMGTVGLARRRSNRIGVMVERHADPEIEAWVDNAVSAARKCYGALIDPVVRVEPLGLATTMGSDHLPQVKMSDVGHVGAVIREHRDEVDAWAITSTVDIDGELAVQYLRGDFDVNPWGLAEAALTHALSLVYGKPVVHAPMANNQAEICRNVGVVDPRRAAEVVSVAYVNCLFKGLMRAPKIMSCGYREGADLDVQDVDALVIPQGVLGLPVWAARRMRIPVIEVLGNRNMMHNRLEDLDWDRGMHLEVRNYAEAAGVLAALRAGIDPGTTA